MQVKLWSRRDALIATTLIDDVGVVEFIYLEGTWYKEKLRGGGYEELFSYSPEWKRLELYRIEYEQNNL